MIDAISAIPDNWEIIDGVLIYGNSENVIPRSILTYKTEREI